MTKYSWSLASLYFALGWRRLPHMWRGTLLIQSQVKTTLFVFLWHLSSLDPTDCVSSSNGCQKLWSKLLRRGGFYVKWDFHLSCSFLLYCIIRRRIFYQRCGSVNIAFGSADPKYWILDPDPEGQIITDPTRSASYLDIFVAIEKKL